jgi:hypothetical protein
VAILLAWAIQRPRAGQGRYRTSSSRSLLLAVGFLVLSLRFRRAADRGRRRARRGLASPLRAVDLPRLLGLNAATYVAGGRRRPRNVPRAMLLGTLVVTVLYLALNAVFLWSDDATALTGKPEIAAIAAKNLLGRAGEVLVTGVVVLALLTSITGMMMAGPRVYARMAEAGELPRQLAAPVEAPPRAAMLLQTVLALGFCGPRSCRH